MADQRRAGFLQLQTNGEVQDARGDFSYNLGAMKREAMQTSDGRTVGYKEMPQTPFIEGEIIDRGSLDLDGLVNGKDLTITLKLANGKLIALYEAFFAGEGTASTEDAKIPVRWEGTSAKEIKS